MKWETRQSVKADYNKYIHKLGDVPRPVSISKELLLLPEPPNIADLEWVKGTFAPGYSQTLYITPNKLGVNISDRTFYSVTTDNNFLHNLAI